jgi:two-component system, chemotaxis family, protein-glutamate methylesterase/glutaminase
MVRDMNQDDIRVLVVDDSAVIRTLLCDRISAAPGLCVAGKARDGRDALEKVVALRPDLITLDLQMPGMDGLAVLDAVLNIAPIPVIMVSALTRAGAAVTLDALDRGAVDYVAKPETKSSAQSGFEAELVAKIRSAACMDVGRMIAARRRRQTPKKATLEQPVAKPAAAACPEELAEKCIALGISTGGPPALTRLLAELRPPLPAMVIVQHMPPQFTGPLAARLNTISALSVREAAHGDVLQPNCVLLAPGGRHLELVRRGSSVKVLLSDGEAVSSHKPSVDVMMVSAAKAYGPNCLGVIMTGMGRDGANGCRAIRDAGGFVLGQDESSSDVYGMNKVAFVEGNVNQQMTLGDAASTIAQRVRHLGCVATTA